MLNKEWSIPKFITEIAGVKVKIFGRAPGLICLRFTTAGKTGVGLSALANQRTFHFGLKQMPPSLTLVVSNKEINNLTDVVNRKPNKTCVSESMSSLCGEVSELG